MTLVLTCIAAPPAGAQSVPQARRWSAVLPGLPAGVPVIAGDVVAAPIEKGVAAYQLRSGAPLWVAPFAADLPLAADADRVYVASGDTLHALDARSGRTMWTLSAGSPFTAPPLAHAGWLVAAAGGDVMAVRAEDGSVVWRRHVGPTEIQPALDGDLLVVAAADGRVVALDMPTGAERWYQALGSQLTEPFAIGGRVYVGTTQKTFLSLLAPSGRVDWKWSVGALPRGGAAVDERRVYFAAMDNVVRALDRGDAALKWWTGLPYRPSSGPVLLGDTVVVPGANVKELPVIDLATGKPTGKVTFSEQLAFAPLFARQEDGTPIAVVVTGGLANTWTLSLLEPAPYPSIEFVTLSALPGSVIPAPQVPPSPSNP